MGPDLFCQACGVSGATSGFNAAKLSGTVKALTGDAQTLSKKNSKTVAVTLTERRRKNEEQVSQVGAGMLLAPGGTNELDQWGDQEEDRETMVKQEDDGGDDGGDGGD